MSILGVSPKNMDAALVPISTLILAQSTAIGAQYGMLFWIAPKFGGTAIWVAGAILLAFIPAIGLRQSRRTLGNSSNALTPTWSRVWWKFVVGLNLLAMLGAVLIRATVEGTNVPGYWPLTIGCATFTVGAIAAWIWPAPHPAK